MLQIPSCQESMILTGPLGVQISAVATVTKVSMTAYRKGFGT